LKKMWSEVNEFDTRRNKNISPGGEQALDLEVVANRREDLLGSLRTKDADDAKVTNLVPSVHSVKRMGLVTKVQRPSGNTPCAASTRITRAGS